MREGPTRTIETALDRVRTVFEQTTVSEQGFQHEDERYRYITAPASDEKRLVHYARRGYEVADNRTDHTATHVVLRIDKNKHDADYKEAVALRQQFVGKIENPQEGVDKEGKPLSRNEEGAPETQQELISRLPDAEDSDKILAES